MRTKFFADHLWSATEQHAAAFLAQSGDTSPKKKNKGETHTPRNKEFPAAHAPAWRWDFRGVRTTLDVDISGSTNRSDPKQHRA